MGLSRPAPLVITTLEKNFSDPLSSLNGQLDHLVRLSLGELAQRDVVHNTLLALRTFQLNGGHLENSIIFKFGPPQRKFSVTGFFLTLPLGNQIVSHLHEEGVLVAVEFKQVII